MLEFTIPGEPNGQGRPRFAKVGGFVKVYDPDKSRNYKAFVKLLAVEAVKENNWNCTDLAVLVRINAYISIPSSKPKKFKEGAMAGLILPTKKPDVDNIFKCVTDAISGIIYNDDKQIVQSVIIKKYSEHPRVDVTVEII